MILLKAQVESVATRKDRTIKLAFSTQELKGKDAAELLNLQNELVTLGISPKGLSSSEIQTLKDGKFGIDNIPTGKSQAQRLRNVIFRNWEMDNEGFEDSEDHYKHTTESIINHFINKLP